VEHRHRAARGVGGSPVPTRTPATRSRSTWRGIPPASSGVELLRTDDATHVLGLRINTIVSAVGVLGAIAYLVLARERGHARISPRLMLPGNRSKTPECPPCGAERRARKPRRHQPAVRESGMVVPTPGDCRAAFPGPCGPQRSSSDDKNPWRAAIGISNRGSPGERDYAVGADTCVRS
jgi:hypothetical protein